MDNEYSEHHTHVVKVDEIETDDAGAVVHKHKHKHKHHHKRKKDEDMAMVETPNLIMGTGNDGGMGLGGGLLGGVLIGALLGRNGGLFGGAADGTAAVNLQSSIDTNSIMQSLGDIKASVPLAEAQVQLALAGQSANITNQLNQSTIANLEGQGSIRANISAQTQD